MTTTSSASSTAGSATEQEGGDVWGRMGMLFQTMKIDLGNDWDEKMKLHQQYVDKKVMMETSERSTAIAGITRKVEQHANATDKDMKHIKSR